MRTHDIAVHHECNACLPKVTHSLCDEGCPGNDAKVSLNTSCHPRYNIELFQEAELLVNITKHVLVPQHIVMTPEEKKSLLLR